MTFHRLYWTADGNTATYQYRSQNYYVANPSSRNTHWYCYSIYWTGLIQGTTRITSTNEGHYYNYDFMDPDQITWVTHNTLTGGLSDGSGDYWASTSVSGEYSYLLRFNYTVY